MTKTTGSLRAIRWDIAVMREPLWRAARHGGGSPPSRRTTVWLISASASS